MADSFSESWSSRGSRLFICLSAKAIADRTASGNPAEKRLARASGLFLHSVVTASIPDLSKRASPAISDRSLSLTGGDRRLGSSNEDESMLMESTVCEDSFSSTPDEEDGLRFS
jgi:hypothetical protein